MAEKDLKNKPNDEIIQACAQAYVMNDAKTPTYKEGSKGEERYTSLGESKNNALNGQSALIKHAPNKPKTVQLGTFSKGHLHGKGSLTIHHADGRKETQVGNFQNNMPLIPDHKMNYLNGTGTLTIENPEGRRTNYQEGTFKEGLLNGYGYTTSHAAQGTITETQKGMFKEDRLDGEGEKIIYRADGSRQTCYQGNWHEGQLHHIGHTIAYRPDESQSRYYQGTFHKGAHHEGTYIQYHRDGKTIKWRTSCLWNSDKQIGQLIIFDQKGTKEAMYDGELNEGTPHGEGSYTLYSANGSIQDYIAGTWAEGQFIQGFHGQHTYTQHRDNNTQAMYYDGNWDNGVRHGVGDYTVYSDDGKTTTSTYRGHWQNNYKHGAGTQVNFSLNGEILSQYEGNWDNNHPHGEGTKKNFNSDQKKEQQYKGMWAYGKTHGIGELATYTYSIFGKTSKKSTYMFENGEQTTRGYMGLPSILQRIAGIDTNTPAAILPEQKRDSSIRIKKDTVKTHVNSWLDPFFNEVNKLIEDPNHAESYAILSQHLELKETISIPKVGTLTKEKALYISQLLQQPLISIEDTAKSWVNLGKTLATDEKITLLRESLTKKDMFLKAILCDSLFGNAYHALGDLLGDAKEDISYLPYKIGTATKKKNSIL